MAKRALSPAGLHLVRTVADALTSAGDHPRVWVACSGGPDSLALAWALLTVAHSPRSPLGAADAPPVGAVVVDHRLQHGSAQVARRAGDQLVELGYERHSVHIVAVEVEADLIRSHGTEAAARAARYDALDTLTGPDDLVLLGHTRDDQAEAVLGQAARASGIDALTGMPPRRGRYLRPLLATPRATVHQACRDAGLAWWDDPHNADPTFTRVRIRHRVLPMLEETLGAGADTDVVARSLAETAAALRVDADFLHACAADLAATVRDGAGLDCAGLARAHPALRGRVILGWLRDHGSATAGRVHVAAVEALVTAWRGQAGVDVPGLRITRRDGVLHAHVRH